jgi:hypothetical protein
MKRAKPIFADSSMHYQPMYVQPMSTAASVLQMWQRRSSVIAACAAMAVLIVIGCVL